MSLLFRLAEWHALAKLCMHTESTLTQMEKVTTIIGHQLRDFCNITCKAFATTELPKEAEGRARKETRRRARRTPKSASQASHASTEEPPVLAEESSQAAAAPTKRRNAKTLNLFVYKLHALGDYVRTIRLFGTTDSYSTQIVSIDTAYFNMLTYSRWFRENLNTGASNGSILVPTRISMSCK
jgi:hypothetical protein